MAVLLISLFVVGGMMIYAQRIQSFTREDVSRLGRQKAFDMADSGIYSLVFWLRSPGNAVSMPAGSWINADGLCTIPANPAGLTTSPFCSDTPEGVVQVSAYRENTDTSLVDTWATAYYYLPRGAYTDPIHGRKAQRSLVRARIRIRYVGDFFAAVPGTLTVGYGSDISQGSIYGKAITFQSPDGGPNPTKVHTAYYLDRYDPNPPSFVQFDPSTPDPIQLPTDPNLITTDPGMRATYQSMATYAPGKWDTITGNTMSGINWPGTAPKNPNGVYYVDGDLHIANGADLTFNGLHVVYVKGTTYIDGKILSSGTGNWLGVISEGDIRITTNAPDNMEINGFYLTGGAINCDLGLNPRAPTNSLTFNGGFIAKNGVDFVTAYYGKRTYKYVPADANMALPFFTYIESYAESFNTGA